MVRARKRFGQHFLEPAWVEKLMRAVAPAPDDTFLEIGPGRGAMTRALTGRARRVIAFEIDRDLAASLKDTAPPHLTIVAGDFLDLSPATLRAVLSADEVARPIRVAGNLPYNVAAPILFKLAELFASGIPLADAHVMLQREVAERLLAASGTRDYGVLTVLIRHAAEIRSVLSLPPGAFRPPPRVQSAVVRLRFHAPDPAVKDPQIFTNLVRAVFTRRRKTLSNALLAYRDVAPVLSTYGGHVSLTSADALHAAGIDGSRRPETLSIAEFARLADVFAARTLPAPGRAVL